MDAQGRVYVSDSNAGVVHRLTEGVAEVWLSGPEVAQPNGLLVDGNRLLADPSLVLDQAPEGAGGRPQGGGRP